MAAGIGIEPRTWIAIAIGVEIAAGTGRDSIRTTTGLDATEPLAGFRRVSSAAATANHRFRSRLEADGHASAS